MKKETTYTCPVCDFMHPTYEAAAICRNKHKIVSADWCSCEICGQGWNCNHYGHNQAMRLAKECEQRHRDKGEVEKIAVMKYFSSGGKSGKPYVITGEREQG